MPRGYFAKLDTNFMGRGFKVYFFRQVPQPEEEKYTHEGKWEVLRFPEKVEVNSYEDWPDDCGLYFDNPDLQQFMDQLWSVGIRPTDKHVTGGQISSIEKHLEAVTKTQDRLFIMVEEKWRKM